MVLVFIVSLHYVHNAIKLLNVIFINDNNELIWKPVNYIKKAKVQSQENNNEIN